MMAEWRLNGATRKKIGKEKENMALGHKLEDLWLLMSRAPMNHGHELS